MKTLETEMDALKNDHGVLMEEHRYVIVIIIQFYIVPVDIVGTQYNYLYLLHTMPQYSPVTAQRSHKSEPRA